MIVNDLNKKNYLDLIGNFLCEIGKKTFFTLRMGSMIGLKIISLEFAIV